MALALAILCWATCGWSAEKPLPNYFTRFWQTQDGLPANHVTAVLQTRDAYLWVGTRSGLARFNGERFVVFNDRNTPEMHGRHVSCLYEAADGTLWIGFETGEVVNYKGGQFRAVPIATDWHDGKIFAIGEDEAGDIWLLNQYGDLMRVRDRYVLASPLGSTEHLLSMTRKSRGGFWIQRDNQVFTLEGSRLKPVRFDGPSTNDYIQGIASSRDGGLWTMVQNEIREWRNQRWSRSLGEAPWNWSPVHTVIETRDGCLAAATADHGLYLVIPGKGSLQFNRATGFPSDWVTSLCEDREGNLWAGTANGGLAMLRTVNVTTLTPPDQWEGRSVLSVTAGPDDTLWMGTEGAGLYRFRDGAWTNFDEEAGIANRYVWSVRLDGQGRVWAGTWGTGVFRQDGDRFEPVPGLQDLWVAALLEWPGADWWVGTSAGLLRYRSGEVNWLVREGSIMSPNVRAIAKGKDGTLWLGLSGGGLVRLKEGKQRQFCTSEGLSSDFVQCLHLDDDGTLWIGTLGGGLNLFREGRFSVISKEQGLPDDVICHIAADGLGFLWISSHNGIIRVSRSELEACANGRINLLHCLSYGLGDGLPTLECSGVSQPAGCRTSDGRLWFATAKGVVGVDPNHVQVNERPPPVVIEEMRVDEQPVARPDGARLRISPGRHRLEVDYAALSYMVPEKVRFKHRLIGLEDSWMDAGPTRHANYSYLPPGDYVFEVIACNNDGIWTDQAESLAFTMLPFFWQTGWFRVLAGSLMVLAGGTVVWLDARRRMRRKLEQFARQQAIERERARIAKDIHDDLGASLTRITLLSQSASSELSEAPEAAADVERIYTTARELTRAMDEIVWAVNPQHDTLDSLANYLGKFAQDYLRAAGIRCHLQMPEQLPQWPLTAEIRHNLFLAFKEGLHNVLKHSNANAAYVSLVVQKEVFVLSLEDNGSGFDPGASKSTASEHDRIGAGNGLANMRRRLNEIGGRCELQSRPGSGTKVSFEVRISRRHRHV